LTTPLIASLIACLRLIEQRLGGEYLIFDFLAHRLPRIAIITIR